MRGCPTLVSPGGACPEAMPGARQGGVFRIPAPVRLQHAPSRVSMWRGRPRPRGNWSTFLISKSPEVGSWLTFSLNKNPEVAPPLSRLTASCPETEQQRDRVGIFRPHHRLPSYWRLVMAQVSSSIRRFDDSTVRRCDGAPHLPLWQMGVSLVAHAPSPALCCAAPVRDSPGTPEVRPESRSDASS